MTTPPPPTIPPHGAPSVSRDARHNRRPGRFALSPRVPEHRGSAPMTIARLLASVALATMLAMPASAQTIEDAAGAYQRDDLTGALTQYRRATPVRSSISGSCTPTAMVT